MISFINFPSVLQIVGHNVV